MKYCSRHSTLAFAMEARNTACLLCLLNTDTCFRAATTQPKPLSIKEGKHAGNNKELTNKLSTRRQQKIPASPMPLNWRSKRCLEPGKAPELTEICNMFAYQVREDLSQRIAVRCSCNTAEKHFLLTRLPLTPLHRHPVALAEL